MAYQALYRKYRPHSFEDFIDQENVKKILVNSIINNKISHAYLFSGPRGIGKTSMAKIFAEAINCNNFSLNNDVCEKCENCLEVNDNSVDIIEIDAASNNGVDQIRELKNKVSVVPSKLKYKVYIIDEVHMLTNSAFNALLKTLEEPPSHVVFILATTEFYEVPETIVSRCQCFSFSRITQKSLENRLRYIAECENIEIDDNAITEIAHYSNGGLRDAIGMLDKINSFTNERITVDIFKQINGMISLEDIENFYVSICDKDLPSILAMLDKVNEQGYDFKNFIEREMIYVRDKIIDFYINKSNIYGDITVNIELVEVLNDILNRLKDSVEPLIITQIYLLKYLKKDDLQAQKNISQEIKKDANDNKIISREINNNTNDLNSNNVNNNKKVSNVLQNATQNNNKNDMTHQIKINEDNRKIRINNAMATANINYKKELSTIWQNLNRYFVDDKYSKVAQLLSDTEVMVVGSEYLILTAISDGMIINIYQNLMLVEEFINQIYRKMKIVVVLNDEFEKIKEQYILDRKNNIVYHVQEEYGKLIEEENSLINQAIDLFGADMVDVE